MNYFQKDVNVCWTCSEDNSTANSFSVFIEGQPVLFVVVLDYRVQWPDMWNVIFPILLIHLKWLCLLVLSRLEMRCGFAFLFTQPVLILSIFIPLFLSIINTMINESILTHYLVLHTICVIGTLGAITESIILAWSSSFWHQTWKRGNIVFFSNVSIDLCCSQSCFCVITIFIPILCKSHQFGSKGINTNTEGCNTSCVSRLNYWLD